MRTIEVCLLPEFIQQHDLTGKIVVVVDIFRATSCIVTGLANGVEAIHPVREIEECMMLGKQGYLMAGERKGKKVKGFDMGNSPFEYMEKHVQGRKVAISTTNGSRAIFQSKNANLVLIGAFLNLNALTEYICQLPQNVVIHCAGWKKTVNLEDTLFAGALIDECGEEEIQPVGDSSLLAHQLYMANYENLMSLVLQSSHAARLKSYGVEKDLEFCMEANKYQIVPKLVQEELIISSH